MLKNMMNQDDDFGATSAKTGEDAVTMPLLGALNGTGQDDVAGELEFDGADENKRIATQSALLIAIVAVIAGGVLFGMRLTQGGSTAEASTEQLTKIQTFIRKAENPTLVDKSDAQHPDNLRGLFADTDTIVSKIATEYPEKAVPVDQVQKNPFQLTMFSGASGDTGPSIDRAAQLREQQFAALQNEFRTLELQSIMGSGRRSVAVIDGEIYKVGQRIGSFTVAGIQAGRVGLLPAEIAERQPSDPRFILEIQTEAAVDSRIR